MDSLVKYYETETDIVYLVNQNNQGLVSVPKDLKDNIRVFMIFKDNSLQGLQQQDRDKLALEMQDISKRINRDNEDGIFLVNFIGDEIIRNGTAFNYSNELQKTKGLVNTVYNNLLGNGKVKKENFIKKVELLYSDNRYNSFINWVCLQNPSKFHAINYQQLFNNTNNKNLEKSDVFINQNSASIFNEPNRQSSMMAMQSNIKPISESLSIGTPKFNPNGQYFGYSANNLSKPKTLVRKLPPNNGSAAFIKWYTTLFILIMSIVIGISISIFLVK